MKNVILYLLFSACMINSKYVWNRHELEITEKDLKCSH